jgi:protein phosphatase
MGTTVVVAMHPSNSRTLVICHVGDSRAYRLRKGRFELLTDDHSWVHEQVAAGFLSEEAARAHPLKNVVTQALGGSGEPRVDILETELVEDDLYLLCSDGLNSMLSDEEILEILREGGLDGTAAALIAAANERGGHDNISVVLLRPQQPRRTNWRRWTREGSARPARPPGGLPKLMHGGPALPARWNDDDRDDGCSRRLLRGAFSRRT